MKGICGLPPSQPAAPFFTSRCLPIRAAHPDRAPLFSEAVSPAAFRGWLCLLESAFTKTAKSLGLSVPRGTGRRRSVYRRLKLSQRGWQVLGPDLNCSELPSRRRADRKGKRVVGDCCAAGFQHPACPLWVDAVEKVVDDLTKPFR